MGGGVGGEEFFGDIAEKHIPVFNNAKKIRDSTVFMHVIRSKAYFDTSIFSSACYTR